MNVRRAESLVEVVRSRVADHSDGPGLSYLVDGLDAGPRWTIGQLDRRAAAIARQLRRHVGPGERAVMFYGPGLDFAAALLGCLYAGAIAVPLYPPRPRRDLARTSAIIDDCRPRVVLTTSELASKLQPALTGAQWVSLPWLCTDDESVARSASIRDPAPPTPADIAWLQYTSGSTATPKGVIVRHDNVVANLDAMRAAFDLTPDSVSVSWLPSFHDMGLIDGVIQPLATGYPGYLMAPADFARWPIRWLEAISRLRADHCGGPNFAFDLCVQRTSPDERARLDLSGWRSAYNGAEPVRATTLTQFVEAFAVAGFQAQQFHPCYGLAEATLMVTGKPLDARPLTLTLDSTTLVSSGVAVTDTDVQIVDPDSRQLMAAGETGEIWVAAPGVAAGYWNRDEATAETFAARLVGDESKSYLRTGDLGVQQDDQLYVAGRIKDLIIIRGRNLYPQDLEATVQRVDAYLRPGCGTAISIDRDDAERLVIIQELDRAAPATAAAELPPAIRQAVVREHDVDPHAILLIRHGTIPRTTSGKLRRHAAREQYLAGMLNRL